MEVDGMRAAAGSNKIFRAFSHEEDLASRLENPWRYLFDADRGQSSRFSSKRLLIRREWQ